MRTALLAFGISGFLAGCSGSPSVHTSADPARPDSANQVAKASAPLDMGIDSVRLRDRVGSPYFTQRVSEGGVLVLVSYRVKNVSSAPVSAADMPQVHLVDSRGVVYDVDAGKMGAEQLATDTDLKVLSDLNPGITVRNTAVFEVSKSEFDPRSWSIQVGGADNVVKVSDVLAAHPAKAGR